ncbi:MAG: DegT/DnrJ/EryC1/StrS family aminotransferase [Bacteroidia bacterium]|nr:DegT/DnrJ/EryC1/StrS family aminotransferase [Bacteroidia bacterium]
MIPFARPRIDQKIIDEVVATLQSGWITTGPRTKLFEERLAAYSGVPKVLCLNSATAGLELMLRWFGVKEGDEVIVPAYTYTATANVIIHCGAKPVFVDVNADDFNINIAAIQRAITPKTKAIMPVDFGGYPCDYDSINALVKQADVVKKFTPVTSEQKLLGRILILSDSAHSIGAKYKGRRTGSLTDVSVFSFHAVKNLVTAEGGAVALNLPEPFDNISIYQYLCIKSLHGQNKDALAKVQKGGWRYDIIEAGYKWNMPDIAAAIGLIELERYDSEQLPRRKQIVDLYNKLLSKYTWAQLPLCNNEKNNTESCYHLYPLRIKGVNETQRDKIMNEIFANDVTVNVHFMPVPMMTYYKQLGYDISKYPTAYLNYSCEISLPLYFDMTDEDVKVVVSAVVQAVNTVLKQQ